ncbi:MAG: hypothetical protein AAB625_03495 [Patescibacteria group bacterium]
MKNLTYSLYSSKNTVFTTQEISLILKETNLNNLKSKINYFVKKGILVNLKRGLYAKNTGYEILEAANKIFTPSYISLETVLQRNGITFQDYGHTIFVLSYQTRDVTLGEYTISFKKIKNEILTNPEGIINEEGYCIACPERAFLDRIYLDKNYYFDHLDPIDWKKARHLLKLYNNKSMERRFKKYVSDFFTPHNNG